MESVSDLDFDAKVKSLKSHIAIVHFTANWSEPCSQMNDVILELINSEEFSNIKFFKVKVDTEDCPALAQVYKIESVPTLLFLKDATVIERMEGADPAQFIRKVKYQNQNADILPFSTNRASSMSTKEDLNAKLKRLINSSKCMVFMKGSPEQPRCGFSKQLMTILKEVGAKFGTFDILSDEEVRQGLKTFSNWPTYPQVYVDGELVGGLDIIRPVDESLMANALEFLKTRQVSDILSENEKGNPKDYRQLCAIVRDCAKLPESLALNLLVSLRANTGAFDQQSSELVNSLLSIDFQLITDDLLNELVQLLISLAVGVVAICELVLKGLVKKFMPVVAPAENRSLEDLESVLSSSSQRSYEAVHSALRAILKISPMTRRRLIVITAECYPFWKRHIIQLRDYNRNLIKLTDYDSTMKTEIFKLIIGEILRLDVVCNREIFSVKDSSNNVSEIFPMELDEADAIKIRSKVDELMEKLDILLSDIFSYIDSNRGSQDSLSSMYRYFLEIFERLMLPAFNCSHVQYVWFYLCGLNKSLCAHFLNWLWLKIQNPSTVEVFRQTAACYLASMLARARFVSKELYVSYINCYVKYILSYMENNDSVINRDVPNKHAIFYSLCQSLFYVITARHKELIDSHKGHEFLKNLRLDKMITCSLNPLRYCTYDVVESFAAVSRTYQFAFCYSIIERNRRSDLYELFNNNSALLSNQEYKRYVLNWFFPFESYMLKKSSVFVQNLYRNFVNDCEEFRNQLESSMNEDVRQKCRRTRTDSHKIGSMNNTNDYEFLSSDDEMGSLGRSIEKLIVPSDENCKRS